MYDANHLELSTFSSREDDGMFTRHEDPFGLFGASTGSKVVSL
jgi:hypothetical protein